MIDDEDTELVHSQEFAAYSQCYYEDENEVCYEIPTSLISTPSGVKLTCSRHEKWLRLIIKLGFEVK